MNGFLKTFANNNDYDFIKKDLISVITLPYIYLIFFF